MEIVSLEVNNSSGQYRNLWIGDLFVLGVVLTFHFCTIIPAQKLMDYDAFFHFAEARQMLHEGVFKGINHLPFTILGERGPDHQMLFHLLLIPFTLIDSFMGLKIATFFFALLCTILVYLFLRVCRVPLAWLFLLLLFASTPGYAVRVSMLRVQSLAIPLMFFAVFSVVRNRAYLAGLIGLLFSWTYHGAVLCFALACISVGAVFLVERKVLLRPALYLCLGVVLGQIINPYLPSNFEYLFFHLLFKTSNPLGLDVGAEWAPASWSFILSQLWMLVGLGACAALFSLLKRHDIKSDTLAFFCLSLTFLIMSFNHGRILEYWIPFTVGFVALAGRDLKLEKLFRSRISLALTLILGVFTLQNAFTARSIIDSRHDPEAWRGVVQFLRHNTDEMEIVLNLHWDDFPLLYFMNPRNRYATGLDPNFLAYASPDRYRLLTALLFAPDQIPDLEQELHSAFNTRFIVSHPKERLLLERHKLLKLVFEAPVALVWRIDSVDLAKH